MPGRPANYIRKHPAAAQQALMGNAVARAEEGLEELPGWERFSRLKRDLLLVLPFHESPLAAYRFVKKDPNAAAGSLRKLRHDDREFDAALDVRRRAHVDIAARMGEELWNVALLRLQHFIQSEDVNDTVRLKAIEMLWKVQGGKDGSEVPAGFTNYGEAQVNIIHQHQAQGIAPRIPVYEMDPEEEQEES